MDIKSGYFPHDEKASQDQKILQLRFVYGWEGYGLFWAIIETMYCDTTGYINRESIGGLSVGYNTTPEKLQSIFDFCVKIDLFKKCEHENYYNPRVIAWKQYRQNCVKFGSLGGKKKWSNTPPNTPPIQPLIASKVKKSKVKESKEIIYGCEFLQFWTIYPNKTGKKAAWDWWKKEKPPIDKVLSTLSWQIISQEWKKENGQYIPDPERYIKKHRWDDEPIKQTSKGTGGLEL